MSGTGYYANITINKKNVAAGNNLGHSNLQNLKKAFSSCPVYLIENGIDADERLNTFKELVMNGNINEAGGPEIAGRGNGFDSFNRDYIDTPDVANIDIEEYNLPSPYVPNLNSPGPGSMDASENPYEGTLPDINTRNTFGSGLKGTYNPKDYSNALRGTGPGDYKFKTSI